MKAVTLVILPEKRLGRNLARLLSRPSFEQHPVPQATSALVLCRHLRYDLVVLGYPPAGASVAEFLGALHARDSACLDTPVLILAEPEQWTEVVAHQRPGLVVAASAAASEEEMQQVVSSLLGVAARAPSRIMVQMRALGSSGPSARLCQTQNISESGALLRTSQLLPVGTRVSVEMLLPGDPRPILTEAEVVRHSVPALESTKGLAVRFLELGQENAHRLRDHIRWLTSSAH